MIQFVIFALASFDPLEPLESVVLVDLQASPAPEIVEIMIDVPTMTELAYPQRFAYVYQFCDCANLLLMLLVVCMLWRTRIWTRKVVVVSDSESQTLTTSHDETKETATSQSEEKKDTGATLEISEYRSCKF